jgi:hypothetical protein
MNGYKCTDCGWEWRWAMGDRVTMVKEHQLAHLIAAQLLARRADVFKVSSKDHSRFAIHSTEQATLTEPWLNDEARQAPVHGGCD